MSKNYQVVVLGGGIGGYTAAIRAAQLGNSVAIVEKDKLGGTCLHRGCIPSKALLRSAELYAAMKESEAFGIRTGPLSFDLGQAQTRKRQIVDQLHKGIEFLMKKNKIDVYIGSGRVIGPSIFSPKSGAVAVETEDGEGETIVSDHLILATGSRPRMLPGIEPDGTHILTSDEALRLEELPSSILIIGGGVIGVEWASMLSDFGVQVTVVEYENRLIPTEDEDLSKELKRLFAKRKIKVAAGAKVLTDSVQVSEGKVRLEAETGSGKLEFEADKLLVAIGRQANVEGLGLENTDIKVSGGLIQVNPNMQTSESHIYAVGDCIGGLQLAHAAAREGILAAEHLSGQAVHPCETSQIPRCVYCRPEVASVGWTEAQAKAQGRRIKTGKMSFKALGKAMVYGENDGFVKVVADADTSDLLGVHIIGPHATDYISEAALAQLLDATPWEVGSAVHPHPTLTEALGEAMLAVDGKAIHI